MDTKKCYSYKEDTKEYLGETLSFKDPLEGKFNLPANCTFEEPSEVGDFEIPVWEEDKWTVKPDYRKHLSQEGMYEGGKPYYDPKEYWWSEPKYMTSIGDIPEGMTWNKIDLPLICQEAVDLEDKIIEGKKYLQDTDYVHLVITEEPEKEEKYSEIIEERKRIRATIDPNEVSLEEKKSLIVSQYGEEALNHLRG